MKESIRRCYLPPEQFSQNTIRLTDDVHHYLIRVLRLKVGDYVLLCDGQGHEAVAVIAQLDRTSALVEVESNRISPPPPIHLTLYQGLPKNSSWEWILQKTTELGVTEIVPVICEHTVTRLERDLAGTRTRRWQRIADEASKQSERAHFSVVHPPMDWLTALESRGDLRLLFWSREPTRMFWELLDHRQHRCISIFIGPEGGFSEREIQQAHAHGLQTVSLGGTILRVETAATVATASVLCELHRQRTLANLQPSP